MVRLAKEEGSIVPDSMLTLIRGTCAGDFSRSPSTWIQQHQSCQGSTFLCARRGQSLVVKFGDIHIIQQEHENYREYVRDFIAGGSAVALDFQHTTHLGAIAYTFLGAAARQMQEFGAFYEHASPDQIKRLLDVLFLHTCGMWYASHTLQLLNWTEDYQGRASYTIKRLEQKTMERSLAVSWQGKLRFQSLQNTPDREFTNPFEALKAAEPIIRSTYMGITHGDLNPRNILVDRTEHPWLIDFQHTRYSHILRDVAMLDTGYCQLIHRNEVYC